MGEYQAECLNILFALRAEGADGVPSGVPVGRNGVAMTDDNQDHRSAV